jgi:hypothetical protein
MQQVTKKMPNKKKTNKNKVMWLLVTMAKKNTLLSQRGGLKGKIGKKMIIIGLQ